MVPLRCSGKESDMITRSRVIAGFTSVLIITAGMATPPALATSPVAGAVQTCWDFSTLPAFPVGSKFFVGDVFVAPTATIEMKHYVMNGNQVVSPANQAYALQTQIAGGPAPEFRTYLINAHVEPNIPVNSVSFDFGIFKLAGVHANLGVNGELVEVTTTMLDLDGRVLGDPALGTVQVNVTMTTPPGANPEKGHIELVAQTGQITKWTKGGRQLFIDNVCF
jgi:hypothetical protein